MKRVILTVLVLCSSGLLMGIAAAQWAVNSPALAHKVYLPFICKNYVGPPRVSDFHMSDSCAGPSMDEFPLGTQCVYAIFNYLDMQGDEIRVKIYYGPPPPLFDRAENYQGTGRECIEVCGDFPSGRYLTNCYLGGFPIKTVIWEVR